MKKIIAVLTVVFLAGCATMQPPVSICEGKPDSVICRVAGKAGQTPEQMAQVLKVANIAALTGDVYTARQAAAFVEDLQEFVRVCRETQATYADVVLYVLAKYEALPPKIQVAFVLLQTVAGVQVEGLNDTILTDDDYDMLAHHLNQQMQIISSFAGL